MNKNRRTKFLLNFAIFVSPLGASVISFPIGGVQMSIFRMVVIIALSVLIFRRRGKINICQSSNQFSTFFMFVWFAYACISIIWSINSDYWLKAVFFIFIGVASMLLFNNSFTTKEDIEDALLSLNYGIAIQSFIGWYEIITKDYRFVNKTDTWQLYYDAGFYREPVAMQGNSNDFGVLMFIGTFVALACFQMASQRFGKKASIILAINYTILTILSGSRACIIGLIIGFGTFLFLQGFKKILFVVIPLMGVFVASDYLMKIIDVLYFDFNATSGSDAIRFGLLKTGIDYCLRTYGFGVGAGQIEAWIETKGSLFYTADVTNLHNWWIELLAAYGVIVFVGYIFFYMKLFKYNYYVVRSTGSKDIKAVSLSVCSILAGFVIASFSSSSNINAEYLWIFWSICIAYQGLGFDKRGADS